MQKKLILVTIAVFLGGSLFAFTQQMSSETRAVLGMGNAEHLVVAYERWKSSVDSRQGAENLAITLRFPKAFSSQQTQAHAVVNVNLLNGWMTAHAQGLDSKKIYSLWLLGGSDNKAQPALEKALGELHFSGDKHSLETQLDRQALQGFYIKRIVLTEAGQPASAAMLSGEPDFMQKLYYADKYWAIAGIGHLPDAKKPDAAPPFAFLLPKPALADTPTLDLDAALTEQIARGRELFLHETFGGNGRTCATCHREDNNHTIDPGYIASLPDDDPLFVAEANPELSALENPKLLRQLGLFLVNSNGFDKAPVFRSAPHLLALSTSLLPEPEKEGHAVTHALGWSADGSTGDGSLRLFTVGAIIQHMPKTLARQENIDFRLPTDDELDALEAYMLSLGRSVDPDLDNMNFSSTIVQRGRDLFHSKAIGTGQCKGCHFNAGANSSTTFANGNRDTGVENMPDDPARLVWSPAQVDGGFGLNEREDCGSSSDKNCYGNGEFNMTSVIEAADTAPYFHNNSVNTLEEAIAYYNSPVFHKSPGAEPADPNKPESVCTRCIKLESSQVTAIALFLRTLNVMENIRSSNDLDTKALALFANGQQDNAADMVKLALAETEDAIEVMEAGKLIPYHASLKLLKQAYSDEQDALTGGNSTQRLRDAVSAKTRANALMLSEHPPLDLAKVNDLFDWAETSYPELFPEHQNSVERDGFYTRYYPSTQHYLGVKNGHVYVSGGQFGELTDAGTLDYWLQQKK
ncbi:MAG: hypothetical protein Q8Q50_09750 [Methylobacter sp.]|nr:hypothetical protein [Methylobacter sp.]